jgi:hypothetical protein
MKNIRFREKTEAIKNVLLAESSIIDWLTEFLLGPYLQAKANELKNDPEWKRLRARMKELEAKSAKLKKEAEALAKKSEAADIKRNKESLTHIKPVKKTKPL